jgi:hypothetical protein
MSVQVAVWRHRRRKQAPPAVQPAALPDPARLRALASLRPGPVVSIYAPLLRPVSGARAKAACYPSALADAEQQLLENGVASGEAERIRKQLASVETDLRRLERPAAGLAVFHDRIRLEAYALAVAPERSVTVANHFALRPLAAEIHRNRRHYVLALSTNRVALFRGDAFGIATLTAHAVPACLEHALAGEPGENVPWARGTRANGRTCAFHGDDSTNEERKLEMERFHQKIERAIETALRGRQEPIVLIATQTQHSVLRDALHLPGLLPEGVQLAPSHLSSSELHALCWPVVERHVAAQDARIADGYQRSVQRGKGVHRIDDLAAAAATGRVHRLWVKPDERVPGAVNPATGAVLGLRPHEDVIDSLVALVLRHGGELMVTNPIPSGGTVAAELH